MSDATPRRTARRRARCHVCERAGTSDPTAQRYLGVDRRDGGLVVELYACDQCDTVLLSLADMYDAEGFVLAFTQRWWKGADVPDLDDWLAKVREWLWRSYTRWDPTRSARFTPYASTFLSNRAKDDVRATVGRVVDGELRPRHAVVIGAERVAVEVESFDAIRESRGEDPVGEAASGRAGDPTRDRSPDLGRALRG